MASQDILAIVALVVSAIALLASALQVLQQYSSTAEGYRRCADSVMGLWAQGTKRKFRARELRFEVIFEAPVIFMAHPANPYGPIPKRQIFYMDGSTKSYEETMTREPKAQQEADDKARFRGVITADDELCNWVKIMSSIQFGERDSRAWDEKNRVTPRGRKYDPPSYSLSCGIQAKKRSWDFMPAGVTKPYATTTLTHLVELTAMLGLHWKTFDDLLFNLRAEGNGFILTSTVVNGLGVMVNFSVTGKSRFEETKVIPNLLIKDYCFGNVSSTILRREDGFDNLNFGGKQICHTLEILGVSKQNLSIYQKSHSHIFPIAFEIIGMLAQPLRIRGSNFRRIPNPSIHPWPSFSKLRLTELFMKTMRSLGDEGSIPNSQQVGTLFDDWSKIEEHWPRGNEQFLDIDLCEAIHDALDSADKFICSLPFQIVVRIVAAHLNGVLSAIDTLVSELVELDAQKEEIFVEHYLEKVRRSVLQYRKFSAEHDGLIYHRSEIWCTLMLRMFCWLLLHSFDTSDRCIVPSDLQGSRMPVFIG